MKQKPVILKTPPLTLDELAKAFRDKQDSPRQTREDRQAVQIVENI